MANVLPLKVRTKIVRALVEGNGVRSASRLTHTDKNAVINLGVVVGEGCKRLHDKLVRHIPGGVYELDERWGIVGKHERRKLKTDPEEWGDIYTHFAVDADTKLVPAYRTGKRTLGSATTFLKDLRERVDGKPQITVDGWPHWVEALRRSFGHRGVDAAMTVKEYQKECKVGDPAKDCGRVKSQKRIVIYGNPDPKRISTSKAERLNLTARMTDRRLTRLTNAHSKKAENHAASADLHAFWYNFVRVHETLGTTPAVAAGLAERPWTIEEMTQAALAEVGADNQAPKATRPRRYQRKTHTVDADYVVTPPMVTPPVASASPELAPTPRAPRPRAPTASTAPEVAAPPPARAPKEPAKRARKAAPPPTPKEKAPQKARARWKPGDRPESNCTGLATGCTCSECATARAAMTLPDAPEELPTPEAAPAPPKRDRSGERGVATVEAMAYVGVAAVGVLAVRRLDDAVKIQAFGRAVPASGVALGAAVGGALVAHALGSRKATGAAVALAVGLGTGMAGRAATRPLLARAPALEAVSGAEGDSRWKRALRWVFG